MLVGNKNDLEDQRQVNIKKKYIYKYKFKYNQFSHPKANICSLPSFFSLSSPPLSSLHLSLFFREKVEEFAEKEGFPNAETRLLLVVVVGGLLFVPPLLSYLFVVFVFFSAKTGTGVEEMFWNITKYTIDDAYPQPPNITLNVKRAR